MGRTWEEIEQLYPSVRPSTTAGLWDSLTAEQLAELASAPSRIKGKTATSPCPCGKPMSSPGGLCAACVETARKRLDPTFRKYRQVSLKRYKASTKPAYVRHPELLNVDFPRGKSGSRVWTRSCARTRWIAAGHGDHPDLPDKAPPIRPRRMAEVSENSA